jgi:Tol biopolymer transport system component
MPSRAVAVSYFLHVAAAYVVACVTTAAPLHAQSIVRVDVANDGTETYGGTTAVDVCDDATKVAFATYADGLDPNDVNGFSDVLLRDLAAGTTKLVSVQTNGNPGNDASSNPRISADGRFVAFDSRATNFAVGGDANGVQDVFLRDLVAGTTMRVSVGNDGSEADGYSTLMAISADGQRILFLSDADNLVAGDTNHTGDAFVKDLATGSVVRASVDSNGGELSWGAGYSGSVISGDGTLVAFESFQPDLAPNDDNGVTDTFLRDLVAGTTSIVSLDSNGSVSAAEWKGSSPAAISSDGRFVLLGSDAYTLAGGQVNRNDGYDDVYVRDRALAMTTRQSDNPQGVAGNAMSFVGSMSPDGLHVAFTSNATDLIEGSVGGTCAFLLTRPLRGATSSNYGDGLAGTLGVPSLSVAAPPILNQPLDLHLDDSLGTWTVAFLMIGTAPAQIPTQLGGDLLVEFDWSLLVAVAPAGFDLRGTLPPDERLAATRLCFQAIELDAGAPHGVSFTAGLELDPGF